ncbi:MAG: protein kinase [Acidobacteriota bacterium]
MAHDGAQGPGDASRHSDVKRIFNIVVDLPEGERDGALRRECGGDVSLRGAVVSLLEALDESATFLGTGAGLRAGAQAMGDAPRRPAKPARVPVSSPPRPQPNFELTSIGKYRNLSRIGQGAMGTVYKAHDPMLDRPVAIKTIRTAAFLGSEEATVRRFQREARIAAGLNHPSIVTVYDFGQEEGIFYLVMELLEGEHLGRWLRRKGPEHAEAKMEAMEKVCEGVAFAHEMGMVHRDLKPSNIFCLPDGRMKVLDFGLARFTEAPKTTLGVAGTPQYMSPEQVRGEAVDARSDVFSLGAMFYEMLTNTRCFPAPTLHAILFQVLQRQPESVRQLNPTLPNLADLIISTALTKETELRFKNAGELLEAVRWLRKVARGECTENEAITAIGLEKKAIASASAAATPAPTAASAVDSPLAAERPRPAGMPNLAAVSFLHESGGTRRLSANPESSPSLLDVALEAGIPHFHECGGRGRCSTCRVRVVRGEGLLPMERAEARVATRLGWQQDIRLACQARVVGDVEVQRLIRDSEDFGLLRYENKGQAPKETALAVVGCRLRNAAEVLQRSAPYDVVHLLNRFYYEVGEPILAAGGKISEYRDGGVVAYFGLDGGKARDKCVSAVRAALRVAGRIKHLDAYLRAHFDFDADIGVGVHFGRTIVGHLGHPSSMFVSALGEMNQVAMWLAGIDRRGAAPVLASEEVINIIEDDLDVGEIVSERDVRGYDRPCYEVLDFEKPDAVLLVQDSFSAVAGRQDEAAELFYSLLFQISPDTRPLFSGVDMSSQGEKLMTVLATAVQGLDRLEDLLPVVEDLGRRHAGYGVELHHYDAVEQALLEMLRQMLGQGFTVELRLAWSQIYSKLASIMIDASREPGTATEIVH